jgi:hypothetical protein
MSRLSPPIFRTGFSGSKRQVIRQKGQQTLPRKMLQDDLCELIFLGN